MAKHAKAAAGDPAGPDGAAVFPGLVFLGVWSFRRARDCGRQEAREHNERTDNMRSHL